MELNSSLSSPRPPPEQLYSPHALGSCSACCLGYFCHLHFTLGLPLIHQQLPPKSRREVIYCIYAMFSHQWKSNIWTNYSPNCTNSSGVASGLVLFIYFVISLTYFSTCVRVFGFCCCVIFPSRVCESSSSLTHSLIWVVMIFSANIYWSPQPAGLRG